MGNQLVIIIKNDSKFVACAYYRSKGTTKEALRLASLAVSAYKCNDIGLYLSISNHPDVVMACNMLAATGAGLDWQETNWVDIPYSESQEKGTIFFTPELVREVKKIGRQFVTIDIGKERIYFHVFNKYNEKDYILMFRDKEFKEIDQTSYTDIFDIMHVPISDFETLKTYINAHPIGVLIDNGFNKWIYKWIMV